MNPRIFYGAALLIAVTIVALLFRHFGSISITNYPPKNEKVVAFGDSLVFGYGAGKGNDFVSRLGRKLGRTTVNLGKSGDTTEDGLLRAGEVTLENSGTVVLLLGGNDYLRRIPESVTRENLGILIRTFQADGAVVVLLGVRSGILIDGREEMYEELSEEYGTVYVPDVLDGIFGRAELMFDGIHPNDAGYEIIAERLLEVFEENKL